MRGKSVRRNGQKRAATWNLKGSLCRYLENSCVSLTPANALLSFFFFFFFPCYYVSNFCFQLLEWQRKIADQGNLSLFFFFLIVNFLFRLFLRKMGRVGWSFFEPRPMCLFSERDLGQCRGAFQFGSKSNIDFDTSLCLSDEFIHFFFFFFLKWVLVDMKSYFLITGKKRAKIQMNLHGSLKNEIEGQPINDFCLQKRVILMGCLVLIFGIKG